MKHPRPLTRPLAALLSVVLSGIGPLAHGAESHLWEERRRAAQSQQTALAALPSGNAALLEGFTITAAPPSALASGVALPEDPRWKPLLSALPAAAGSVRRADFPASPVRTVIHIQDVHQNLDAQRNIGRAVAALAQKGRVPLVALEGSFGPIRIDPYRRAAEREIRALAADDMLAQNEISGPVHAAIASDFPLPFFTGVDDRALHEANVEAYKRSAPKQEERRREVSARRADLEKEKIAAFSPAMKDFDQAVQAYRAESIGLGDYVRALAAASAPAAQTRRFLQALEAEERLDFAAAEKERARFVEDLAAKASPEVTRELVAQAAAYRLEEIRHGDFYRRLKDLGARAGLSLQSYPAFRDYVAYVLTADALNAGELFDELSRLEAAGYARLAHTEAERRLVADDKRLDLTGKLVDFSLAPAEWKEYERLSPENNGDFSSFENFYRNAEARNRAMTDNLIRAMDRRGAGTAVLVTGGFHSEGIESLLKARGVACVTFTPKVGQTSAGGAYLQAFTREKTPLEKIFAAEKLFVAENPAAPQTGLGLAARVMAAKPDGGRALLNAAPELWNKISSIRAGWIRFRDGLSLEADYDAATKTFTFRQSRNPAVADLWPLASKEMPDTILHPLDWLRNAHDNRTAMDWISRGAALLLMFGAMAAGPVYFLNADRLTPVKLVLALSAAALFPFANKASHTGINTVTLGVRAVMTSTAFLLRTNLPGFSDGLLRLRPALAVAHAWNDEPSFVDKRVHLTKQLANMRRADRERFLQESGTSAKDLRLLLLREPIPRMMGVQILDALRREPYNLHIKMEKDQFSSLEGSLRSDEKAVLIESLFEALKLPLAIESLAFLAVERLGKRLPAKILPEALRGRYTALIHALTSDIPMKEEELDRLSAVADRVLERQAAAEKMLSPLDKRIRLSQKVLEIRRDYDLKALYLNSGLTAKQIAPLRPGGSTMKSIGGWLIHAFKALGLPAEVPPGLFKQGVKGGMTNPEKAFLLEHLLRARAGGITVEAIVQEVTRGATKKDFLNLQNGVADLKRTYTNFIEEFTAPISLTDQQMDRLWEVAEDLVERRNAKEIAEAGAPLEDPDPSDQTATRLEDGFKSLNEDFSQLWRRRYTPKLQAPVQKSVDVTIQRILRDTASLKESSPGALSDDEWRRLESSLTGVRLFAGAVSFTTEPQKYSFQLITLRDEIAPLLARLKRVETGTGTLPLGLASDGLIGVPGRLYGALPDHWPFPVKIALRGPILLLGLVWETVGLAAVAGQITARLINSRLDAQPDTVLQRINGTFVVLPGALLGGYTSQGFLAEVLEKTAEWFDRRHTTVFRGFSSRSVRRDEAMSAQVRFFSEIISLPFTLFIPTSLGGLLVAAAYGPWPGLATFLSPLFLSFTIHLFYQVFALFTGGVLAMAGSGPIDIGPVQEPEGPDLSAKELEKLAALTKGKPWSPFTTAPTFASERELILWLVSERKSWEKYEDFRHLSLRALVIIYHQVKDLDPESLAHFAAEGAAAGEAVRLRERLIRALSTSWNKVSVDEREIYLRHIKIMPEEVLSFIDHKSLWPMMVPEIDERKSIARWAMRLYGQKVLQDLAAGVDLGIPSVRPSIPPVSLPVVRYAERKVTLSGVAPPQIATAEGKPMLPPAPPAGTKNVSPAAFAATQMAMPASKRPDSLRPSSPSRSSIHPTSASRGLREDVLRDLGADMAESLSTYLAARAGWETFMSLAYQRITAWQAEGASKEARLLAKALERIITDNGGYGPWPGDSRQRRISAAVTWMGSLSANHIELDSNGQLFIPEDAPVKTPRSYRPVGSDISDMGSAATHPGKAQHGARDLSQEDRYVLQEINVPAVNGRGRGTMRAVFNGLHGSGAAHRASVLLPGLFDKALVEKRGNIEYAMRLAVERLDKDLADFFSATTVTFTYVVHGENIAHVLVLGNDRVLIPGSNPMNETSPTHSVQALWERSEAKRKDKDLEWDEKNKLIVVRDPLTGARTASPVSRALGGRLLRHVLNRTPEFYTRPIESALLIGTNSLFENMDVGQIKAFLREGEPASKLVAAAVSLQQEPKNVTAIIYRRNPPSSSDRKPTPREAMATLVDAVESDGRQALPDLVRGIESLDGRALREEFRQALGPTKLSSEEIRARLLPILLPRRNLALSEVVAQPAQGTRPLRLVMVNQDVEDAAAYVESSTAGLAEDEKALIVVESEDVLKSLPDVREVSHGTGPRRWTLGGNQVRIVASAFKANGLSLLTLENALYAEIVRHDALRMVSPEELPLLDEGLSADSLFRRAIILLVDDLLEAAKTTLKEAANAARMAELMAKQA